MTSLQTKRLCAILSVGALLSVLAGCYFLTGKFDFRIARDGVGFALMIWLATGSNIARWLMGVLSAGGCMVAVGVSIWLYVQGVRFEIFSESQQTSFVFFELGAMIHGFVGWRLLFLPKDATPDPDAVEEGGNNSAALGASPRMFDPK